MPNHSHFVGYARITAHPEITQELLTTSLLPAV
jgi:hypothetical protein